MPLLPRGQVYLNASKLLILLVSPGGRGLGGGGGFK